MAFHFPKNNVYLFGNDSDSNLKETSAKDILNSVNSQDNSGNQKNTGKSNSHLVVSFTLSFHPISVSCMEIEYRKNFF